MRTYTTQDLYHAELDASRARHVDSADAARDRARHAAMAAAFGIDPSETVDLGGALARLADRFAEWQQTLHSPFSDYLEAPPAVIDLYQAHGHDIALQLDQLNATVSSLVADARDRIGTVAPDATITDDDLRAHGFDPDVQDNW